MMSDHHIVQKHENGDERGDVAVVSTTTTVEWTEQSLKEAKHGIVNDFEDMMKLLKQRAEVYNRELAKFHIFQFLQLQCVDQNVLKELETMEYQNFVESTDPPYYHYDELAYYYDLTIYFKNTNGVTMTASMTSSTSRETGEDKDYYGLVLTNRWKNIIFQADAKELMELLKEQLIRRFNAKLCEW